MEDGSPVWTLSISVQLPETFVLLWVKPFEKLVFRPQSQASKIQDFWISQFPDFHLASLGEPVLGDGGTDLSVYPNRYPFWTVRTPQASLVGEKLIPSKHVYQNWSVIWPPYQQDSVKVRDELYTLCHGPRPKSWYWTLLPNSWYQDLSTRILVPQVW